MGYEGDAVRCRSDAALCCVIRAAWAGDIIFALRLSSRGGMNHERSHPGGRGLRKSSARAERMRRSDVREVMQRGVVCVQCDYVLATFESSLNRGIMGRRVSG